jgi:hypothetical protein
LKYPSGEPVSPWSGLKTRLLYFLSRQKIIKVSLPRNYTSPRHQAFAALDALGPAAKEALPALEKLLHEHPPDPHCTYIIARIGPAGLPLLNQALTNDERIIRMEAHVPRLGEIRTSSIFVYATSTCGCSTLPSPNTEAGIPKWTFPPTLETLLLHESRRGSRRRPDTPNPEDIQSCRPGLREMSCPG